MITATIHDCARSICTSEISAAEVSSLSASGSITWPKRRDLLAAAGEVAVEPVGERGEREDRRADELLRHAEDQPALELRQQHHHEQRHEEDARDGQRVRQVHRALCAT